LDALVICAANLSGPDQFLQTRLDAGLNAVTRSLETELTGDGLDQVSGCRSTEGPERLAHQLP
jgi:hypothetical protein